MCINFGTLESHAHMFDCSSDERDIQVIIMWCDKDSLMS